ncbi:MAG TPA: flagellar hook-length control protein FliK [Pantanalinema sp.]
MGEHVRSRIEALKGMAIDLIADVLSDGHLAQEVEKLGLPPEPTRLLAARALVAEQGRLDPMLLKEVERGLSRLERPEPRDAAAIAFLVVRRLPVTPETALMVLGRHDAPQTSGERLKLMVEQVSLQWGPEDESRLPSREAQTSRVPHLAEGLERLFATIAPERREALAEAVTRLLAAFASPADEAPEGEAHDPSAKAPSVSIPSAPAQPSAPASLSPARPSAQPPASLSPAPHPGTIEADGAQPSLHEAIVRAYRALPAARQPAFEAALDALLSDFLAEAGAPIEVRHDEPPAPAPLAPKAEALARLQGLALPEGGRTEVEAALRRLVAALVPPEADLARMAEQAPEEASKEAAVPRERLAEVLERVVDRHPVDADARALRDEIRFGQLRAAGDEGLAFTIPLWWSRGSGEIRVHERQGEGDSTASGPSGATRVVIALDTPHLHGIRIDLLLNQRQVNCQVSLQDPAAAAFLEARLPELRDAIEGVGVRVGTMGLRKEAQRRKAPGTAPASGVAGASGVDFYG